MQWVCYIHIQGFYAGVARRVGLAPADRPVVVLRDGKVFDGCRDAFAGGLTPGAPARQALRDCPRAVQVEFAGLDTAETARALWDGCLRHTPYIEPGEPHQLFLALPSPGSELTAAVKAEAAQLIEHAAGFGFVAFAGIGPSKLAARAAALANREGWLLRRPGAAGRSTAPEAVTYVAPAEAERFLAPLPPAYLPAPPEVLRRLARLGLKSIGEAARIPESEWIRQLGPLGRQVAQWSHGIDPEAVRPCYPPRTLTRRVEFSDPVGDRDHLESVVSRGAALLARQLAGRGEGCQQAALTVEREGGPPVQGVRTLAKLQQEPYPIQQALQGLLREALAGGEEPVTVLIMELGLIGPMPWVQLDLWEDGGRREREERLQRALSLLHERFPARMVGLGPRQDQSFREQMLSFVDPYRWTVSSP